MQKSLVLGRSPCYSLPMQDITASDAFAIATITSTVAAVIGLTFYALFRVLAEKFAKKNLDKRFSYSMLLPVTKHKTMQTELDNLIAETKGKFFSITFVKKDGSIRVINGKDKYQRLLKGGEYKGATAGFVPFVNRNTETWASAHKDAIVTFRCGKLVKQVSA